MSLTPQVLFDVRTYFASLDATGYSNKVEVSVTVDDLDKTTFASAGSKERVGGLADTQVTSTLFWQAGDLTMPDDVAWAQLANGASPLTIVPTSGAVGSLAYLTKVLESQYKPSGDAGKLLMADVTWLGNQPVARGQILHPQGTARTTTGTGTGVQFGAVGAGQRMYANLHVLSVAAGGGSLAVVVESAPDNTFAAATTRMTFATASALTGQASSVLGAITDTWWRTRWTITGGSSPSFLFAVSAGVASK